jgi:hypothetical protein
VDLHYFLSGKEHHTMSTLTPAQQEALYDAQRSGAAWLKVQAITDDPTNDGAAQVWDMIIDAITPAESRALDILLKAQSDQPFGQLADGTIIYGGFDTTKAPAVRSGCVSVRTPAIRLTADCDGFCSGENQPGDGWSINFDGASLDELHALRDFLNSGAVERMLAAAVAWENGDTQPPAFVQ